MTARKDGIYFLRFHMVLISFPSPNPTLDALDALLVQEQHKEPRRKYLGASSIGDPCSRKLWYRLHTDHREVFDADTLRKFNSGHRSEAVMAEQLRKLPFIELHTHKEDGWQYGFQDKTLGPHNFSGNYDGVILGILEAPKTFHLWEHKDVNEKSFKELKKLKDENEKTALEKWSPVYYAQAVTYMEYENLSRHYLTVSTPGLRAYTSIRTNANPEFAEALKMKAKRIITAKDPPERIGGPDFWLCRMCSFNGICHQ